MYKSLSNYLITNVNNINDINDENTVNEGIFDIFKGKKGKQASDKAKGFFGIIGVLFKSLTGDGGEDDKLTAELKAQAESAEAAAAKREKELADSAEGALIAKLRADFEQKEKQLSLANAKRVAAYNAQARQFREESNFWKNNTYEYTAEQLEAFNRKRQELYQGLGTIGGSEIQELNQLMTIITTDENGNTLPIKDIQAKAKLKEGDDGYDAEFIEKYNRLNELAKKHKKPMIEGAKSDAFYKEIKHIPLYANEYANAKAEMEEYEKMSNDFEKKSKQVSTFNEKTEAHEKAVEKYNEIDNEIKKFSNGDYKVDANGKVKIKNLPTLKADESNNNDFNIDDFANSLKEKGVPESIINKAKDAYNNSEVDNIKAMNDVLGNLSKEEKEELEKSVQEYQQQRYDDLANQRKNAKANVENNPKPDLDNDPEYADIKNLSDQDRASYDVTTDAGRKAKEDLENDLKKRKDELQRIEKERAARAEKNKTIRSEYSTTRQNKVPDEIKDDVKKAKQGIELGEEKNKDGEVGIKVGDKFIKKPDPSASKEEIDNYNNQREELIMSKKISDLDIDDVKKQGDKYILTIDGESAEISKEDAIQVYAQNAIKTEQHALLLDKKQKLADNISKCIVNGDLDPKKYKSLSKAEKEMMKKILTDEVDVNDVFAGVDLTGNATIDAIDKFKKAHKDITKDDDGSFDEYINDLDDLDDIDDEEVEDEDNDAKADDVETDEEEEYVDDEGKKQTRHKKIENPAKIWKRRKKKNGKGITSSYFNKNGDSISKKEYKQRMETFKKALKAKQVKSEPQSTTDNNSQTYSYTQLRNYILEKLK